MRAFFVIIALLMWWNTAPAQKKCACSSITDNAVKLPDAQWLIKQNDPGCKAKGYEMLAKDFFRKKELDSAEIALINYKDILEKDNCSNADFLELYKLFANLYNNRADFEKHLATELQIASILESQKDTVGIATSALNISNIFNRMKQAGKGMEYCRQAIPYILSLAPSSSKASLYTKVAQRYFFYYEEYKDIKYLDTTELYAREAQKITEQIPVDRKVKFLINTRFVSVAIERKQYEKALQYINDNLDLCERDKDIPELAVNFSDKAEVYLNMKQFDLAKKWADSSMVYTLQTESPPHIANVYNLQYRIADQAGDATAALAAYQQEKNITDSINNAEKARAINELEKKYNQAKNERTINELAQQKQIYLLIAIAALLAVLAVGIAIRQQALKHKQKILLAEQRLNLARMNPHFFFNALASLQSFALMQKDSTAIASHLSKFSHIMRETLESTYKEYITVEQEIEFLNKYMDVQNIRFPQKFSYDVQTTREIEADELLIPSMIIQPFVENAIEHGFTGIDYAGHIDINFSLDKKNLQIHIIDNGKGLTSGSKDENIHISRASQIIKDRIYLLNSKLKTKASFSIANGQSGKGVEVIINLPVLYK